MARTLPQRSLDKGHEPLAPFLLWMWVRLLQNRGQVSLLHLPPWPWARTRNTLSRKLIPSRDHKVGEASEVSVPPGTLGKEETVRHGAESSLAGEAAGAVKGEDAREGRAGPPFSF